MEEIYKTFVNAVFNNNANQINYLIDTYNLQIDKPIKSYPYYSDDDEIPCIIFACFAGRHGNYDSVKVLLERGSNPNSYSKKGLSALKTAANMKNLNITKLLLKYGADPNYMTGGSVALTLACNNKYGEHDDPLDDNDEQIELVKLLVSVTDKKYLQKAYEYSTHPIIRNIFHNQMKYNDQAIIEPVNGFGSNEYKNRIKYSTPPKISKILTDVWILLEMYRRNYAKTNLDDQQAFEKQYEIIDNQYFDSYVTNIDFDYELDIPYLFDDFLRNTLNEMFEKNKKIENENILVVKALKVHEQRIKDNNKTNFKAIDYFGGYDEYKEIIKYTKPPTPPKASKLLMDIWILLQMYRWIYSDTQHDNYWVSKKQQEIIDFQCYDSYITNTRYDFKKDIPCLFDISLCDILNKLFENNKKLEYENYSVNKALKKHEQYCYLDQNNCDA